MTRRILIKLGSTTDGERCGDCPLRCLTKCDVWGALDERKIPAMRLHECIAAETEVNP